MDVLSAENLTCIKQDRTLFENISLSVAESELLYIRGQNGSGKTSLLRILVGLSDPIHGQVKYKDENIRQNAELFHASLFYFGHKLGLNLKLNALENLAFWCQLHHIDVSESHLFELLAELGLVGLEDLPVGSLSAGQQRRVALARLWLKDSAKLWVLDEPFTALDVQGIEIVRQKLIAHLSTGGAVIITSHQELEIDYTTKELILAYQI